MKKQVGVSKKATNLSGLGGSTRKKASASLRKVPSWHRQMPSKGGSLSRLVRLDCTIIATNPRGQRGVPYDMKNTRADISTLYGIRRNDDDEEEEEDDNDESSDNAQETQQNISKSQSDTSMGTTSSWACLNAPWDDDEGMETANQAWQSSGFHKLHAESSSLLSLSLKRAAERQQSVAPLVVGTQQGTVPETAIAKNPSEMSLGDPLEVMTRHRASDAFASENMTNVGWGSTSLSRILKTPMEATPSSIL